MSTLAMLDGLLSPLHWAILIAIVVLPICAMVIFVIWFVRRRDGRK
ncbi:MAG: hypothetical protein AABZ53_14340 [Planctomycetota bacterium]